MTTCTWGDICTLEYGKAIRDYRKEPSEENPVRVYGTNGPIGWTSEPLTDGPGIIVGRKGAYRGVHYSSEPFFVIDTAYYFRKKCDPLNLKWVYYNLLTVDINRIDVGGAIPTTSRDAFYAVPVTVPPQPVQDSIVAILSAYDDLIENGLRRVTLLEESSQLLYREWFVHLRFPGHEQTPVVNGLPQGWERKTLGDLLTLKRGYDLPDSQRLSGDVPIVSSSGITGYHSEKKAIAPGVVTGRYGTLGEVFFVQQDYWPLNTALYVSDFKDNHPSFIAHLLKHVLGGTQSDKAAVPGLNRNVVHAMPVLCPPKLLRDQFSDFAYSNYRQIHVLETTNTKLRAARDVLLPRLMNGEIVA